MTRGRAGLGALNSGINNSTLETQSLAYLNMAAGMSAPGTSYTSATPTLKDKKGLVKELGQRAAVDILSQGMSENEKEIMNTAFRGYYGKIEQKKNDKKAQSAAIRSTVVTAVTTVATMGASGALGPGFNSFLTTVGAGSANMGAAIVNLGVQVADGSRNGADGMAAGFINGAIGMVTQRGELDIVGKAGSFLEKTTLGLGVSYDRQAGWGGMIGVGGSKGNIGISFSQKGNTNINGSLDVGRGLQITGSITSNGEKTIGANFNPSNEGPRRGYNFGVNYDMNGGGLSGNVGYTDAESGIGITSTIDRNGLSTSSQLNGNNIGTMTEDGYQSDEFNWAQNNINLAQNRTDELATAATEKNLLKEKNMSDAEIDAMSPEDRKREANQILREKENKKLGDSKLFTQDELNNMSQADREIHLDRIDGVDSFENMSADTVTKLALGLVGSMAGLAGIAFAWGSTTTPAPERSQIAEPLVGRRREDEEGGETATDRDGKIDGETSQSNILNGLTLASISVAEQNTKGEKEGDGTEGDSDSDGSQSLETIRESNLLANDLELVDRKPRVLTDNDGNPLYFAQATSDGIPRTDGSGNVRDRGPVDINIDRIKIESEKVTNKIGEPVINSEKISLLNSMPEIEFNDKIFKQGIINKENYFVTEKDGRLIGIQFQTDGKIKETQFEKKSKYLGFVTEYSPITQRIIDANNRYRPIEPSSEKYFNLKESILDNAFNSKKKLSDKEWENLFKKISEQRNADLSDFEKDYLNDTLKSLRSMSASDFNLIKAEYSNNKNTDLIGPRWRFDSLLPSINNLIMPTFNESIPAGGRLITFENGVEIIERDLDIDKEDLKNIVQNLKDHAQNIHGVKKDIIDTITKENAIGTNQLVKYLIPEIGSDGNGNILWKSYSFHKEDVESNIPKTDILHRYTDESTAIMFVSASQRWKELQIKTNSTNSQPIFVNDFSMPGAGKSVYNHHNTNSSIDIGIPGLNGSKASTINSTDAATREVYKDKNYDREKTIDLIKIMAESVPTGKRLEVFFNDPDVINYFKGTNISVTPLKDHHHHLHFQLSNEK